MNSADVPFFGLTGRGLRVAVIDSGVHASHPHIHRIAGGVTIGPQSNDPAFVDLIGHGTAVMAAIQEKAPDAEYYAVRVFYRSLRTTIDALLRAIEWSIENRMDVVNLSLGTTNPAHRDRFLPLIDRARDNGLILVSARDAEGVPAFPGCMAGVAGVALDWDCPRDAYYCDTEAKADEIVVSASGYPRSLPGVPKEKNLHGISFAVANAAGFIVQAYEAPENRSFGAMRAALHRAARSSVRS